MYASGRMGAALYVGVWEWGWGCMCMEGETSKALVVVLINFSGKMQVSLAKKTNTTAFACTRNVPESECKEFW